jgi:CBS domain containing-hemolysin-like protein
MSAIENTTDRDVSRPYDAITSEGGWFGRLKSRLGFKNTASIRDDIEDALETPDTGAEFSAQERAMLRNILSIRSVRVVDVMIPRAEIVAVSANITLADLLRVFRTQGHSRLPAYGETLDDPKGMVHIRDFLDYLTSRAESGAPKSRRKKDIATLDLGLVDLSTTLEATKLLRPVLYAPPSMPAMDLMLRMQSTRTHMALIVDEYGGTDGLVSIEDLVEMIVGDIEDEHDSENGPLIEVEAGGISFVADAKAGLEEVAKAVGIDVAAHDAATDVDTIGGLIVTLAQRVPSRGEMIPGPLGLEFEVLDADPRRIKRVRIHRRTGVPGTATASELDPTIEDGIPPLSAKPDAAKSESRRT